jgi:16S rRNA (adenine1518-N6/adenine1519-N6)-dimethyltransferase
LTAPFSRKRFGQNFLEPAWVAKVVRAIDPKPDEVFLEIGPGRGALTRPLAARSKGVIAYEIDRDLVAQLDATAASNVRVVPGDFLESIVTPAQLDTTKERTSPGDYPPSGGVDINTKLRVAGNLPYNVASPILFRLVEIRATGVPLTDATVMLQREVADRLLAQPGTKDYGVLTVLIRHSADVERLLALPPGAFRPAPKVHSSLVRLRFHAPDPPVRDLALFRALVQAVFTRRRKTIANALLAFTGPTEAPATSVPPGHLRPSWAPPSLPGTSVPPVTPAEALDRAMLDGRRRPETLSIAEFARLADGYASVSR